MILPLLLLLASACGFRWMENTEHTYHFECEASSVAATVQLQRTSEFPMLVHGEFSVVSIGEEADGHHMHLRLHALHFYRRDADGHELSEAPFSLNLKNWFSFVHEPSGSVARVRYPQSEHPEVVQIKKGLVGLLAIRTAVDASKGWSVSPEGQDQLDYHVPDDFDHSGAHNATYRLRRLADGQLSYHKTRHFDAVSTGFFSEKTVLVGANAVPHTITAVESISTGTPTVNARRTIRAHAWDRPVRRATVTTTESQHGPYTQEHTREIVHEHIAVDRTGWAERSMRRDLGHEHDIEIVNDDAHDMADLTWAAGGKTKITLGGIARSKDVGVGRPDDLIDDSVKQADRVPDLPPWEDTYATILDMLDCLELSEQQESGRVGQCASTLLKAVRQSSEANITWMGSVYLAADMVPTRRAQLIDALVDHGSPAAQAVIVDMVLLAETPLIGDLTRALTDIATIHAEPTEKLLNAMEAIVFHPEGVPVRAQSQTVREQAMLAIGALVRKMQGPAAARGDQIAANLIDWLYTSGPTYDPRARRSVVEEKSDHRLPVMYALGNTQHALAVPHLLRHANGSTEDDLYTTAAHRVRYTAVNALESFGGNHIEHALLTAAFTDPNLAVRRTAIRAYRSVPRVRSEESYELPLVVPQTPMAQALADHMSRPVGPNDDDIDSHNVHCAHNATTDEWIDCLSQRKHFLKRRAAQPRRRALFGLELDINIKLPSMGFTLPIGSDTLGAKFGLSFGASARIYFSILKSLFSVDCLGDAYGKLLVGFMKSIIGFGELGIFNAHAAFKGSVGYDLSMIADFDIDDLTRLFNRVQEAANKLMTQIKTAIDSLLSAVGAQGACGAKCKFEQLWDGMKQLPDTALKLFEVAANLGDYVGPNATQPVESDTLRRLLGALYSVSSQAQTDMQRMYTLVFDSVSVTLPQLAQNMSNSLKLMVEAVQALPKCPVAATFALLTVKEDVEEAVALMMVLKVQFEDAFYITSGEWPPWMVPTPTTISIFKELLFYLGYHSQVMQWKCNDPAPANPVACELNRTNFNQEMEVDDLLGQLTVIGDAMAFVQNKIMPPINTVTQLYSDIMNAWDFLKAIYNKARAIFDFLFGVRFDKTFPRNVRDKSETCGSGLYPSTQSGNVPTSLTKVWGAGADLVVIQADKCDLACQTNPQQPYKKDSYSKDKKEKPTVPQDKYITAPLKGTMTYLSSANKNVLVIRSSSFSVRTLEFLISNIKLLPEIKSKLDSAGLSGLAVKPGWQLGTPLPRSSCEDFVHVAVRERSNGNKTTDPKDYVQKTLLALPGWVSEADQWYVKILSITVKQGTFGAAFKKLTDGKGREKKGAAASAPKRRAVDGDDTTFALLDRQRRDVCSEFADVPDLCLSAGLPAFSKSVTFFKRGFNMIIGGFIPIELGFTIGGQFSVLINLNFCLVTLKVTVTPVPGAVATFDVYAAVGACAAICGGLKISGKVADLKFPIPVTIGFTDKPISLTIAMDMELIPLTIIFSGFVQAFYSTIFEMDFFKFAMDPIKKNLFTVTTKSKDNSPPVFSKRCAVLQAANLDATDPAVSITFAVSDPDTKVVKLTWAVGSKVGGTDIVPSSSLDPAVTTSVQPLKIENPMAVYFTIQACNPNNACSTSSCQLSSWDSDATLFAPVNQYDIQSHPSELEGSFGVADETLVVDGTLMWAYGTTVATAEKYNDTTVGSDISPWVKVSVPGPTGGVLATSLAGVRAEVKLTFLLQHNTLYFVNARAQNKLGFINAGGSKGVLIDLIPPFPAPLYDPIRCTKEWFDFYARPDVINNLTHQGTEIDVRGCELHHDEMQTLRCSHIYVIDWMGTKLNSRCIGPTYLPNHRELRDSGTVFAGSNFQRHRLYQSDQTFVSLNWIPFTDEETGIFMYTWALGTKPCLNDALDWLDPFSSLQSSTDWSYDGSRGELSPLAEGKYYLSVRAYNNIIRGGPLATTLCDTVPLIIDITKPVMNTFRLEYSDKNLRLEYSHNITDKWSDLQKIAVGLGFTQFDELVKPFEYFYNRSFTAVPATGLPEGVYMYGRLRAVDNVNWRATVYSDNPLFLDYSPPFAGTVLDGPDYGVQLNFTFRDDVVSSNWNGFYDPQSGVDYFQIAVSQGIRGDDGTWLYDAVTPNSTYNWRNLTGETLSVTLPLLAGVRLQHNTVYMTTIAAINRGHRHLRNSSYSQGVLVDLTCPSYAGIRAVTYAPGFPNTADPAFRCACPCVNCTFNPSNFGNLCNRLPGPEAPFVYAGTNADLIFNNETGRMEDLQFSASNTVVQGYWSGFADAESAIVEYQVAVGMGRFNPSVNRVQVYPEMFLPFTSVGLSRSFRKTTFNLHDGAQVYIIVQAINGAGLGTVASSSGYTVDMTPPELDFIGDGPGLSVAPPSNMTGATVLAYGAAPDVYFWADMTSLAGHFSFADPQSGVTYIEMAIFRKQDTDAVRIFPRTSAWLRSDDPARDPAIQFFMWTAKTDVESPIRKQVRYVTIRVPSSLLANPLSTGAQYFFRARAYNAAGTMTSADSSGVLIDDTPPTMDEVFVGVLSHEAENLRQELATTGLANIAVLADTRGVKARWGAYDPESGIVDYAVAVGALPVADPLLPYYSANGLVDRYTGNANFTLNCPLCARTAMTAAADAALTNGTLAGFIDVNDKTAMYIDISPNSFEVASPTTRYAVSVVATNGALATSERASKAFRLARKDVAGTVYDGPDPMVDISLQAVDSMTVNFFGWESDYCGGLMGFEWAVGSSPEVPDVQEFVPFGLVMQGDHGLAQAVMPSLRHNQSYFATVRGVTLCRIQQQSQTAAIAASQGPTTAKAVEFLDTGRQFIESVSSGVRIDKTAPTIPTVPVLTPPVRFGTALYRGVASGQAVVLPAVDVQGVIHVRVFAESGRETEYFISANAVAPSAVTTLANLTVGRPATVAMPAFQPGTLNYSLTVPFAVDWITLVPTLGQLGQSIQVGLRALQLFPVVSGAESQQLSLAVGVNCMSVYVLSEDRLNATTYTVCVTRQPPAATVVPTSLRLQWGAGQWWNLTSVFRANYSVSIPYRFSSVQLTATLPATTSLAYFHAGKVGAALLSMSNVPVVSDRVSPPIPVVNGVSTLISIFLVAEDGVTTNVTTLNVTRAAPETDLTLTNVSLVLSGSQPGLTPVVEAEAGGYAVFVDASCTSVLLSAAPASALSLIKLNAASTAVTLLTPTLVVPSNRTNATVLTVVAESGATQAYRFRFVLRNASIDTNISRCSVAGITPAGDVAAGTRTAVGAENMTITGIPFEWTTLLLSCQTGHPLANISFKLNDFGITTALGSVRPNANFTLAIPPVLHTIPQLYVADLVLALDVMAEDGLSTRAYSLTLSYALPDSDPRLGLLAASYPYKNTTNTITLSPAFDPAVSLYTGSVPFSVSLVLVQFSATSFGTARVTLPGKQQSAAMLGGQVNTSVYPGNTEILIEAIAQDGLTVRTYTIKIAQLVVSDSTAISPSVVGPSTVAWNSTDNATLVVTVLFAAETATLFFVSHLFANMSSSNGLGPLSDGSGSAGSARGMGVLAGLVLSTRQAAILEVVAEDRVTATNYSIVFNRLPGSSDCTYRAVWVYTPANDTNVTLVPSGAWSNSTVSVAFSSAAVYIVVAPTSPVATITVSYFTALYRPGLGQPTRIALAADLASYVTVAVTSEAGSCTQTLSLLVARLPPLDVLAFPASITVAGHPLSPTYQGTTFQYTIGAFKTSDLTVTVSLPPQLKHASISVGVVEQLSTAYTVNPEALQYTYDVEDYESGIANSSSSVYLFRAGVTSPLAFAVHDVAGPVTEVLTQLGVSSNMSQAQLGLPFGVTVGASNTLGVASFAASKYVTVDQSPPITSTAQIVCPQFQSGLLSVSCRWYGFSDLESSIAYFLLGIGRARGDFSVFLSTPIGWTHSYTAQLTQPLQHGDLLYVTLTAVNYVGMLGSVTSAPILVDTTAPVATGRVWELGDVTFFAPAPSVSARAGSGSANVGSTGNISIFALNTQYTVGQRVSYNGTLYRATTVFDAGVLTPLQDPRWVLVDDAVCQQGDARIALKWDAFVDPDSGLDHYAVALGTVLGGKDLTQGWLVVSPSVTALTILEDVNGNDLALVPGMTVYAIVEAVNGVNMTTTVLSNGVAIAFPEPGGVVKDGLAATDARFQAESTSMSASWTYEDPCEIVRVEVMILREDDFVVNDWRTIWSYELATRVAPAAVTQATVTIEAYRDDALPRADLQNGRLYYFVVRLTNTLSQYTVISSNGVTVQLEPPARGAVYDGPVVGQDIDVQASVVTFSASWFDCRLCTLTVSLSDDDACGPCFGSAIDDAGLAVQWYMVGVGSNPSYPNTKSNIMPFTYVGLQTKATFEFDVPLVPGVQYFFTVRGYTMPNVYSEAVSDGIRGGSEVSLQPGTVLAAPYWGSLTNVRIEWTEFISKLKILRYNVSIFNTTGGRLYNARVGLATNWTFPNNLSRILQHGANYSVCVSGLDESLTRNTTCRLVLVDLTPPCVGPVRHASSYLSPSLAVAYASDNSQLTVLFDSIVDGESDISAVHVALLSATQCDVLALYGVSTNITANYKPTSTSPPYGTACPAAGQRLVASDAAADALDWQYIGLPPLTNFTFQLSALQLLDATQTYVVLVRVVNQAGLTMVVASPAIRLDTALPQAGTVVVGPDFRAIVNFQNFTSTLTSTWVHAYTRAQLACPIYRESTFMSRTAAPEWAVVSRYCRSGVCGTEFPANEALLSDDVAFDPKRVEMDPSGLRISMVFPRTNVTYTGAVVTPLEALVDGTYRVVAQIPAGDDIISGFTWWGEDAMQLREPMYRLLNGTESTMAFDDVVVSVDRGQPVYGSFVADAFGVHVRQFGNTWLAIFWSSSNRVGMRFRSVPLTIDPSDGLHEYRVDVQTGLEVGVETQADLYVDGVQVLTVYQFPALVSPLLALDIYPASNFVDRIPVLRIALVSVPLPSTRLCKYGDLFFDDSSPIAKYEVAVGTLLDPATKIRLPPSNLVNLDDIAAFQLVDPQLYCRACVSSLPCDVGQCNASCSASAPVALSATVRGLALTPGSWFARCNIVQYNAQCLAVCPVGTTYLEVPTAECRDCHELCEGGCTGPQPSNCKRCVAKAFKVDGACAVQCPTGRYNASSGQCDACHPQCRVSPVYGCSGPGPTQCERCAVTSFSTEGCVDVCPFLTYQQPTLQTVVDLVTNQTHTAALEGLDQCLPCHASCLTGCTGPASSDCNDCLRVRNTTYTLEQWLAKGEASNTYATLAVAGKNCVDTCPTLTFPDAALTCRPCHASCALGCVGPDARDCLFCPRFTDNASRHCVDWCGADQFVMNSVCFPCSGALCNTSLGAATTTIGLARLNAYGLPSIGAGLHRVAMSANLTFAGDRSCRQVWLGADRQIVDTIFINQTVLASTANTTLPLFEATTKILVRMRAQDESTTSDYRVVLYRQPPASDGLLTTLALSDPSFMGRPLALSPAFSTGVFRYYVSVSASLPQLAIDTATHRYATVELSSGVPGSLVSVMGGGRVTLPLSNAITQQIAILIQPENRTADIVSYNITLVRQQVSHNAFLSGLQLLAMSDQAVGAASSDRMFNPSIDLYVVTVPYRAAALLVTAAAMDVQYATINVANSLTTINSNTSTSFYDSVNGWWNVTLANASANTVLVTVVAEDGLTNKTYTLTVLRAPPSGNAWLTGVQVVAQPSAASTVTLDPPFSAAVVDYTAYIQHPAAAVRVSAITPADVGATAVVVSDGMPLAGLWFGATADSNGTLATVVVQVTSESGQTIVNYTFTLVRLAPSDVATLDMAAMAAGPKTLVLQCGVFPFFVNTETSCNLVLSQQYAVLTVGALSTTHAYAHTDVFLNGLAVQSCGNSCTPFNVSVNATGGDFTLTLLVWAESNETLAYTFAFVWRPVSNTTSLSSITPSVGALQPAFDPGVFSYVLNLTNDVDDVDLQWTVTHEDARVTYGYLQNVTNSSTSESCASTSVLQAQCAGVCVTSATSTVENAGVYGSLGFVALPRITRNVSVVLSFANQTRCTRTTRSTMFTAVVFLPLPPASFAVAARSQIRIFVAAENRSVTAMYAVTITRDPSADPAITALTLNFSSPVLGALEVAPVFTSDNWTASVSSASSGELTFSHGAFALVASFASRDGWMVYNFTNALGNFSGVYRAGDRVVLQLDPSTNVTQTLRLTSVAPDGRTKRIYTIAILRPSRSEDASLSLLSLSAPFGLTMTPTFLSTLMTYTLLVPYSITNVTLSTLFNDLQSTALIGYDTTPDDPVPPTTVAVGDFVVGPCTVLTGFGRMQLNYTDPPTCANVTRYLCSNATALVNCSNFTIINNCTGVVLYPVANATANLTANSTNLTTTTPLPTTTTPLIDNDDSVAFNATVNVTRLGVRVGMFSLEQVLLEADLSVDSNGFFGTAGPEPVHACDGFGGRCTACANTYAYNSTTVMVAGPRLPLSLMCAAKCPTGMFQNASTGLCIACDPSCALECAGPGPAACLPYCRNVSVAGGASVVTCSPCESYSLDGTCLVDGCPALHYAKTTLQCLPCSSQCVRGCSGPDNDQCTACAGVLQMSSAGSPNATCETSCSALFYRDSTSICQPCHVLCSLGCTGPGADMCVRPINVSIPHMNATVNPLGCLNVSYNGSCVLACPNAAYLPPNLTVCATCHPACVLYGCTGPTARDCKRLKNKNRLVVPGTVQDTFFIPAVYYVTVRATDAATSAMYSTSAGVTVDTTPPAILSAVFLSDPLVANPEERSYLANNNSVTIVWNFEDMESDVQSYEFCLGASNFSCDVLPWTRAGVDANRDLLSVVTVNVTLVEGRPYVANIRATNYAGLQALASSAVLIVDLSPPVMGIVNFTDTPEEILDGIAIFSDPSTMAVTWQMASDTVSGITGYDWGIGTAPGVSELLPWTPVGTENATYSRVFGQQLFVDPKWVPADKEANVTLPFLEKAFVLQPGQVYYNNLRAWNGAFLSTLVTTLPFLVRRAQDKVLDSKSSGLVAVETPPTLTRRAVNLTGSSMFVTLPVGAVPQNTLLSIVPLSQDDLATTYTFGTGSQIDVLSRQVYTINASSYLSDPNLAVSTARRTLAFVGLSFGIVPSGVNGSSAEAIQPISVGGTLALTWNASAVQPKWMYWERLRGRWETVASTCGSAYRDTLVQGTGGVINISAQLCDPYNPVPTSCPPPTPVCQTFGTIAPTGLPCYFPFNYNGRSYSSCITFDSPSGQAWCSTGPNVTAGNWGFCHCNATTGTNCTTTGATDTQAAPCVLPFVYNSVNYSTCASGVNNVSWCPTAGGFGFCSCLNTSFTPSTCVPASSPATLNGTGSAVQVALMLVGETAVCVPPVVPAIPVGPLPQGYSFDVYIQLSSSLVDDEVEYVLTSLPLHGTLDTAGIATGLVVYHITAQSQYYYGNDTFTYYARMTGRTVEGGLSPCPVYRSAEATVTVMVDNVNDAPFLSLDVFNQPSGALLARYGNNSASRFTFQVDINEDEVFSAYFIVNDHDGQDGAAFIISAPPTLQLTPAWVLPYATFEQGIVASTARNSSVFDVVGIETVYRVDYTPPANYNGQDAISYTYRDLPPSGLGSLFASTPDFEFQFSIAPVNDAPFVFNSVLTVPPAVLRANQPLTKRLRYYDAETPQPGLYVSLAAPSRGYFDSVVNLTTTAGTSAGQVQLLSASFLNTTDTGDYADAVVFQYTPSGGSYTVAKDTFEVWVSDGANTTRGLITIVNPNPIATRLTEAEIVAIFIGVLGFVLILLLVLYRHYYIVSRAKVGPSPSPSIQIYIPPPLPVYAHSLKSDLRESTMFMEPMPLPGESMPTHDEWVQRISRCETRASMGINDLIGVFAAERPGDVPDNLVDEFNEPVLPPVVNTNAFAEVDEPSPLSPNMVSRSALPRPNAVQDIDAESVSPETSNDEASDAEEPGGLGLISTSKL